MLKQYLMKMKTKRFLWKPLIMLMISVVCPFFLQAKGNDPLKYDIASAGVGADGYALVKVSLYVDKPKKATVSLLKKAAVHGIIFRGVSETGVTGFNNLRPLVTSAAAAQQHGDFFNAFFQSDGQYLSYADMVESTTETVKVNKKEYRVTTVVKVNRNQLRTVLQQAGIVRRITEGFN